MKLKSIPFTQAELFTSFSQSNEEVADFFAMIPAERFFAHSDGVWSAAENLVHLLKSVSPVAQALKWPKFVLAILFGRASQSSRSFADIQAIYLDALSMGATAAARFISEINDIPADPAEAQQRLIDKWNEVSHRLPTALTAWDDHALDRHRLPHPLLGKLTVREMLFFTLYHNTHHVNDVQRLFAGDHKLS